MAVFRMFLSFMVLALFVAASAQAEPLFCDDFGDAELEQLELRLSQRAAEQGEKVEVVVLARALDGQLLEDGGTVDLVIQDHLIPVFLSEGYGIVNVPTDGLPVGIVTVFARKNAIVSRQDELEVLAPTEAALVATMSAPSLNTFGVNMLDVPLNSAVPDGAAFKLYWGNLDQGASMVPLTSTGNRLRSEMVNYDLPVQGPAWLEFRGHAADVPAPLVVAHNIDPAQIHLSVSQEQNGLSLRVDNIRYTDGRNIEDGTPVRLLVQNERQAYSFFGQTLSGSAEIAHLPAFLRTGRNILEIRGTRLVVNAEEL